ncbi:unnamed protein product [Parajaminaea phylloscopi]
MSTLDNATASIGMQRVENATAAALGYRLCPGICLCQAPDSLQHISRSTFADLMAERLGSPLKQSGWPVQLVSENLVPPGDFDSELGGHCNDRRGSIWTAGFLLTSLLAGKATKMNPLEACASNMYCPRANAWDNSLVAMVEQLATRPTDGQGHVTHHSSWLSSALPRVVQDDEASCVPISPCHAQRYGFPPNCIVSSSLPSYLMMFSSFLPTIGDAGLELGQTDTLLVPLETWATDPEWSVLPNPLLCASRTIHTEGPTPAYLGVVQTRQAALARAHVRDRYSNANWQTFQRVMGTVSPGGSVGLDNKVSQPP